MTAIQPPLFIGVNGEIGADELGLPYRDLISEGVVGSGDFLVAQRAAGANMSVDVAAGAAWVKGDSDANAQPTYRVRMDATQNITLAGADASKPRIDRIIARVYDSAFAGTSLVWQLETVSGTPTTGATLTNLSGAGAVPATALLLANVLVPAAAGSIVTADLADVRRWAIAGGSVSPMSAGPPSSPRHNEVWEARDVDANGTRWAFRYNALSSSAYKWEFIGGSDVVVPTPNGNALAGAGWNDVGGGVVVPRAGDYEVVVTLSGQNGGTAQTFELGVGVGSATTVNRTLALFTCGASADYALSGVDRIPGVAAGTTLWLNGFTTASGAVAPSAAQMAVRPIRIS